MESGTATLGITVAARFRRKRNMTITTSTMVSINSNCTSLTEALMVAVRSVKIAMFTAAGNPAWSWATAFYSVHNANNVGTGLPLDIHNDRRIEILSMRPAITFSIPSVIVATSTNATGQPFHMPRRWRSGRRSSIRSFAPMVKDWRGPLSVPFA